MKVNLLSWRSLAFLPLKLAKVILILSFVAVSMPMQAQSLWSLQSTENGWQWVPPSGPPLCKYAGVSTVDTNMIVRTGQFPTLIPGKYPTMAAWAQAQSDRLKSWGFNSAGLDSNRYASSRPSGGVPVAGAFLSSAWLTRDDKTWHIKTLNHNYSGEVCGSRFYVPSSGGQMDAFDQGTAAGYLAAVPLLAHGCGGPGGLCWDSNTIFIVPEEGDDLFGFNSINTHQDLALIVLNGNPVQNTSAGGGYTYPDKMVYAKTAMRDFLANEYGCSGSADPAASNYCGNGAAASALAALNSAWYGSTIYSTWNTSDAGGIAGIHNGTYSSYGTGTGFMDENGRHTLNAATKGSCLTFPIDTWAFSPAIANDTHNYVAYFVQTYAQKLSAAWAQSSVSPHPPIMEIIYDGPSNAYTAAAPYFDGFWISAIHENTPADRLAFMQRIIAASSVPGGKSMPLIYADYTNAGPDSYEGHEGGLAIDYDTQALRGAGMVADWTAMLPQQDANGKYVLVGIEHWPFYDQVNDGADGGMVTAFADNPYDGSASIARATHSNTWQPSHIYSSPSLIWDGANYEAKAFGPTPVNCTSGGTPPSWATNMGAATTDGSCTWYNEGPYTLKPEQASRIPSTAVLPGVAYGDTITPISNFLNAGICDPSGGLFIVTTSLPGGIDGVPYSATLTASGGTPPYTWAVISGSLPAGLSLSSAGAITGTPTTAGDSSFTVQVTDAAMLTARASLTITITTVSITTTSLPVGISRLPYSATLTATGGTLPYAWSITVGALPPGLSLNGSTGAITGTPTTAGLWQFTAQVCDANWECATAPLSITIGKGNVLGR